MKEIIWINGKKTSRRKAKVSIFDRGLLYGDGLFETMRSYKGSVFHLDGHLKRLYGSARSLNIKIPYKKDFLKNIISKSAKSCGRQDAYIRIEVTRGEGAIGIYPSSRIKANVILILKPFAGYSRAYYKKGARLIISGERRNNYTRLSNIKAINYLGSILALIEARKKGKDDAIMLNTDGFIAEATTSNIFIVKDKKIITPRISEGLLPGITREIVIKLGRAAGFRVLERRLSVSELKKASEVFLTNSVVELRGITEVDNRKISDGKIGRITELLHGLYRNLIKKELGLNC